MQMAENYVFASVILQFLYEQESADERYRASNHRHWQESGTHSVERGILFRIFLCMFRETTKLFCSSFAIVLCMCIITKVGKKQGRQ